MSCNCNLVTSLTVSQSSSDVPHETLIDDEVLWRLTCTHLKYLSLKVELSSCTDFRVGTGEIGGISHRSGQLPDELLHILHLKIRLDCGR